jgi:hypothetical protein
VTSSISSRASDQVRGPASAETLRQRSQCFKLGVGRDSTILARPHPDNFKMIGTANELSVCPDMTGIEIGRAIAGAP